ncbi:aldo/keto reductase [Niallia nealsonii]
MAIVYLDGTSKEIVGRALKDYANRDEIVLATKVYHFKRVDPHLKERSE